jgi:signal transduction histidine kinase
MDRARRLWSAVSAWLVPLGIVVIGATDLLQNGSLSSEGGRAAFPGPLPLHAMFLLLVTVPLYWRATRPVAVAIAVSLGVAAWLLAMFNLSVQPPLEPALAVIVALFALASVADGHRLVVGTATAGGIIVGLEGIGALDHQGIGNVFGALLIFTVSWVMGRIVHQHRVNATGQQNRADRLEKEQEERAQQAAERERSRIARELHDVVAHGLSMIVVQAAAERRVLPPGQASTGAVLEAIEHAGRQAMTELRRLLGVLRKDDFPVSLAPQPGLSELPQLVADLAEAGVAVLVSTTGDVSRLPPGLDLSVYRIIQESLTNVVKHAHASRADVQVRCRPQSLEIDVRDDGIGSGSRNGGFGLIGMRERVTVYGGHVQAGPLEGGGYRVHAVLPFEAAELSAP